MERRPKTRPEGQNRERRAREHELVVRMQERRRASVDREVIRAREVFAENLRRARLAKGLSQADLGQVARVEQINVSKVERGKGNLSLDLMVRLSAAVGCSLEDLLRSNSDRRAALDHPLAAQSG
jgi:ribosome-binding protein aMBF1 (putative translation factor)